MAAGDVATEAILGLEGKGTSGSSSSSTKGGSSSSAAAVGTSEGPSAESKNGHSKAAAAAAAQEDGDEAADVVGAILKESNKEIPAASQSEEAVVQLPQPSRADWEQEMKALRATVEDSSTSDEEKIRSLHEALVQRIEDIKAIEETKVVLGRRMEDATKEKERCDAEVARVATAKAKLETSCRELQQSKSSYAKENQRLVEEEQNRHVELKERFQQAIKDVQEKMDAELEVREHFLKENEELRGKLQKFTETYEAQERQLAEERESRTKEMEAAEKRLTEHETMCAESKVKATALEKENEGLKKSTAVLRTELQTILGKFDEFHDAVTGSNQRHGECKVEIDDLQSQLQELEKDNADLKANAALQSIQQEQQVAQKQRDALDKLCDNLAKENKKIQENLKSLRAQKASQ